MGLAPQSGGSGSVPRPTLWGPCRAGELRHAAAAPGTQSPPRAGPYPWEYAPRREVECWLRTVTRLPSPTAPEPQLAASCPHTKV